MKQLLIILFFVLVNTTFAADNFYNLKAKKINGDTLYFSELCGKKLMIVNVASYCGYTYQYSELENLYKQYGGEKFEIIAFPANNFGNQEPGTDLEIEEFCTSRYGVTFTMMSKISVKGFDKHPVYQWLTLKSKNGVLDREVDWNFQKYLIDENGNLWRVFSTQTSPLHTDIINWLEITTSVEPFIRNSEIAAFPNPATEYIEIDLLDYNLDNYNYIYITNTLGEVIEKIHTTNQSNSICIDLSNYSKGIFFIRIGNKTKQFIKI